VQIQNSGGPGQAGIAGQEPDFASWSIRELRDFLEARGIDTSAATEKEELISKVSSCLLKFFTLLGMPSWLPTCCYCTM
jgi:Putative nuclear envelope organisation protein